LPFSTAKAAVRASAMLTLAFVCANAAGSSAHVNKTASIVSFQFVVIAITSALNLQLEAEVYLNIPVHTPLA
jgi:hypothetical protein